MPTAAKFIAAVYFAALTWFVSGLVVTLFADGIIGPRFSLVNAGIGLVIGWVFLGRRMSAGMVNALGLGFTTAAAILLWCTFFQSFAQMIERSYHKVYKTPVEALVDVFRIMIDNAHVIGVPVILVPLGIGGLLGGFLVEIVSRNFR